jgi:hypothetical protein
MIGRTVSHACTYNISLRDRQLMAHTQIHMTHVVYVFKWHVGESYSTILHCRVHLLERCSRKHHGTAHMQRYSHADCEVSDANTYKALYMHMQT